MLVHSNDWPALRPISPTLWQKCKCSALYDVWCKKEAFTFSPAKLHPNLPVNTFKSKAQLLRPMLLAYVCKKAAKSTGPKANVGEINPGFHFQLNNFWCLTGFPKQPCLSEIPFSFSLRLVLFNILHQIRRIVGGYKSEYRCVGTSMTFWQPET